MAGGGSQEEFFWDTHPWVMSEKCGGAYGSESGCEEKLSGDKKVVGLSIDNNHSQINNPEMESTGGPRGCFQETVATNIGSGSKNNGDASKTNNEEEVNVKGHENKVKRGIESSDHDLHIWTERERRKKMRNMFHQLHALLPQLSPKADKSTIVDEAVHHIKTLQNTLQKLKLKKAERLHGISTNTKTSSQIQMHGLNFNTRELFLANHPSSISHSRIVTPPNSTSFPFPISSPTVFQTWTSSNVTVSMCGLNAHFSICSARKPRLLTTICFMLEKYKLEIISAQIYADHMKTLFMIHTHANTNSQFVESFPCDEVYKRAAAEITLWVKSKSS